ncbi:MAG TPA: family 1 encapsulin nanocompartment shell protein [Solirubrobacterales bacterium]|nr:family 1 encapsulin nanocompartment shell protein [Solirubrobacterales bacterium]
MNHLLRGHAPISDSSWQLLDDEARERLRGPLAARRLVDFAGPLGWEHSATNLGRVETVAAPNGGGVTALRRRVLPLVELRADFAISRAELRDDDRGAVDVDLEPLDQAAKQIAICENVAVFHGWAGAGIGGIAADSTPIAPEPLGASAEEYPRSVARAVEAIRQGGVEGPYGLALGPDEYTRGIETAEHGGYPLFDHLAKILEGPIVWAPGVKGAVVLSLRGGDFLFESGQDLAVGYDHHDAEAVHLYLEESFSFVVATPEAAAPLSS